MDFASGDDSGPAVGHRVPERAHRQSGLQPPIDRVPDDPSRAGVRDGAQVEPALTGAVLGEVRQSRDLDALGRGVPLPQVITARWTRLLPAPLGSAVGDGEDPLLRTRPLRRRPDTR